MHAGGWCDRRRAEKMCNRAAVVTGQIDSTERARPLPVPPAPILKVGPGPRSSRGGFPARIPQMFRGCLAPVFRACFAPVLRVSHG
eukprot:5291895-Prymnesium_polylepis.2